jgi:hypothetical protein
MFSFLRTVKASNFGDLGPFFRRACYHQNASYRKMNGTKFADKLSICEVGSVRSWHKNPPKEATNLARNGLKFP